MEKFRKPLKNTNTTLVFTQNNKLTHNLVRNKPPKRLITSGIYEIKCGTCKKIYVGETGRDLKQRIKEHKLDIRSGNDKNALFTHLRDSQHQIDFKNLQIIYPSTHSRKRRIIESAIINHYTEQNKCLNQNKGFSPNNVLISTYVRQAVKLGSWREKLKRKLCSTDVFTRAPKKRKKTNF